MHPVRIADKWRRNEHWEEGGGLAAPVTIVNFRMRIQAVVVADVEVEEEKEMGLVKGWCGRFCLWGQTDQTQLTQQMPAIDYERIKPGFATGK